MVYKKNNQYYITITISTQQEREVHVIGSAPQKDLNCLILLSYSRVHIERDKRVLKCPYL